MSPCPVSTTSLQRLQAVLQQFPAIELAVLVGSHANGQARLGSDWDIAIRWTRGLAPTERFMQSAALVQALAQALGVGAECIDLIDLQQARLAMRAVVAEEGIPLKGDGTLAWHHFLSNTWRELEEFDWRQRHAA